MPPTIYTPKHLPIVVLPHIIFPGSRLTIAQPRSIAEALIRLARAQKEDGSSPIIAAAVVPRNSTNVHEWATACRVVRIVSPPSAPTRSFTPIENEAESATPYLITLQGLTRIKLEAPTPSALTVNAVDPNLDSHELTSHSVSFPTRAEITALPDQSTVDLFRDAALRLLDRLATEGGSTGSSDRRDAYIKAARLVSDVGRERAAWMADVLVGSLSSNPATEDSDYDEKLAILSTPAPNERIKLSTNLLLKQASISEVAHKVASSIDDTVSRQQKEYFLRQQLAAINRELDALHRSNNPNPSTSSSTDNTSELDADDGAAEADDLAQLRSGIERLAKGSEERKTAVREWRKMKRIPPGSGSAELGVIRGYLEWISSLPWPDAAPNPNASSEFSVDENVLTSREFLKQARSQLDSDHYGLEKVKKRLVEYLAVLRLKALKEKEDEATAATKSATSDEEEKQLVKYNADVPKAPVVTPSKKKSKGVKGPILLLVGPPGTGKTSLGQSIATALHRPYGRIALGGVRDEAEIRGHRRTYVASSPGLIIQALRKAGRPDPVIVLDEIDKLAQSNFHGDPAAALLEVLDPEQNHSFNDHYINVPFDLSRVLFICTANSLETISSPLLDRCEVIQLSGYTYDEKMNIARRFLLPKQLTAHALPTEHLDITDSAMLHIATQYTREAGVRSLDRTIGAVVRYKAVEWSDYRDARTTEPQSLDRQLDAREPKAAVVNAYTPTVQVDDLEKILGVARGDAEEREREERRGLVFGLVVSGMGEGGIMPIETILVPGSGNLRLTGSLGEVIKESAEIALSWVKNHAYALCITTSRSQNPLKVPHPVDLHLHLPAGATKKDGPSAGVAMTCAFVSLLTGACISTNTAMTGEVSLRGRVTAVGGIKEKVLGAHRAQMKKVILSEDNRKDVEQDVPRKVRDEMEIVFVRTVPEALEAAFGRGVIAWRRDGLLVESRL